jgi:hypothetical protein
MLKKFASGVLASLRGSTYQSVRLASSLTAALLDGHFEHPAWRVGIVSIVDAYVSHRSQNEFFRSLLIALRPRPCIPS